MEKLKIGGKEYHRSGFSVNLHSVDAPISTYSNSIKKAFAALADKTVAGFGDVDFKNPDLSYLQGIFVTSGVNRNRDVFLPSEMLRSFVTARYKPINIEHKVEENESLVQALAKNASIPFITGTNTIIGSIYDVAFVEEKTGKMILASDFANMPADKIPFQLEAIDKDFLLPENKYHIIIAAALWKFVFPKTIADIVDEVNLNDRALSMESYFLDYDFLVDGEVKNRWDHPEYESMYRQGLSVGGQKIGRVLKTILWGAGGLVKEPANPNGFDFIRTSASFRDEDAQKLAASASLISTKDVTANRGGGSESKTTKAAAKIQGDPLKMELDKLIDTNSKLVNDIATANANLALQTAKANTLETAEKSLKSEVEALKASVASLQTELDAAKKTVASLTGEKDIIAKELVAAKASLTDKDAALAASATKITDLETKVKASEASASELTALKASQIVATRKTALEQAGLLLESDSDESVASLTDEEFKVVVDSRTKIAEAAVKKAAASVRNGVVVPFLDNKDGSAAMRAVASTSKPALTGGLVDVYKKV